MNKLVLPLLMRLNHCRRYLGIPQLQLRTWVKSGRLRSGTPRKGHPRLLATREVLRLVEEDYGVPVEAVAELPAIPWTDEEFRQTVADEVDKQLRERPAASFVPRSTSAATQLPSNVAPTPTWPAPGPRRCDPLIERMERSRLERMMGGGAY